VARFEYFEKLEIPHPKFKVWAYAIPCDLEVRGNAMASDDDAFDKEVEDKILADLDRGVWRAWFDVQVTASFSYGEGFIEAHEYLVACSYADSDSDADALGQVVDDHGLSRGVVEALEKKLAALKAALVDVCA
jgi:hypothetical protein